jgi:hypothetical protein
MGKIRHNYFFGIRTPWTLASEEVWNKTHRTVGPWWIIGGVVFLFLGFLPKYLVIPLLFVIIVVLALGSTVYSYIIYRRISSNKCVVVNFLKLCLTECLKVLLGLLIYLNFLMGN